MSYPKTVAVVRTYKVKRSGALQVLSMATYWNIPLVAKAYPISRALLGVTDTKQTGWHILPKRSSLPASHAIR